MPRRRAPPRLWFHEARGQYVIRDGPRFVRLGTGDSGVAGQALAQYLGKKHAPEPGSVPLISDVLGTYAKEHLPHTKTPHKAKYNLKALLVWWQGKTISAITSANCRAYAATKAQVSARKDLELLRAALHHWHRNHGPLPAIPAVTMPRQPPPRERWLTRSEAARLLWAARRTDHLKRFILLGLYTGSRSGVILGLQWSQIDIPRGVMARRAAGKAEDARKRTPPVRLGKRILSHLRRWERLDAGTETYLCHHRGGRVDRLRRSWENAVRKAGLDSAVTPHCLRRTRATWLMAAGVSPWEASQHLGMSMKVLESIYAQHHPDYQARAAEV